MATRRDPGCGGTADREIERGEASAPDYDGCRAAGAPYPAASAAFPLRWLPLLALAGLIGFLMTSGCDPATAQALKPPCAASVVVSQVDTPEEEALLAQDVECLARAASARADVLQKLAEARKANPPVPPSPSPPTVPAGPGGIAERYAKAFADCGYLLMRSRAEWGDTATSDRFDWFVYKQFGASAMVPKGANPDTAAASEPVVSALKDRVWAEETRCRALSPIGDSDPLRIEPDGRIYPPQ